MLKIVWTLNLRNQPIKIQLKTPKLISRRIRKRYYKTFGDSQMPPQLPAIIAFKTHDKFYLALFHSSFLFFQSFLLCLQSITFLLQFCQLSFQLSNLKFKDILLYKVVRFVLFCLKLKILITTKLIEFSILGNLHIGPVMVLGYFIFRFKSWVDFKLFSQHLYATLNTEPLDDRGAATSTYKKRESNI